MPAAPASVPFESRNIEEIFGDPVLAPPPFRVPLENPAFDLCLRGYTRVDGALVVFIESHRQPLALQLIRPRASLVAYTWLEAILGPRALEVPLFERGCDPVSGEEQWFQHHYDREARARLDRTEGQLAELATRGPEAVAQRPEMLPVLASAQEVEMELNRGLIAAEARIRDTTDPVQLDSLREDYLRLQQQAQQRAAATSDFVQRATHEVFRGTVGTLQRQALGLRESLYSVTPTTLEQVSAGLHRPRPTPGMYL